MPSGTIDAPLARSSANRKKMAVVEEGRGKRAVTHYRLIEPLREAAMVECRLETGRTHQVRVHLAAIGHPVVGDARYGGARATLPVERPFLHAAQLAFDHPSTGERCRFESPLPPDLESVLASLR